MKIKRSVSLTAVFAVCIMFAIGMKFGDIIPTSSEADSFIQRVASALSVRDSIPVSDIADFQWEYVCISRAPMGFGHGRLLSATPAEQRKLDQHSVVIAFFDRDRLQRVFGYSPKEIVLIGQEPYLVGVFPNDSGGATCAGKASAEIAITNIDNRKGIVIKERS